MLKFISTILFSLFLFSSSVIADIERINNATFFGISVIDSDVNTIRKQLWDIGGFNQARSSKKKRAFDKFFPSYQAKDSYFIEFRYTSTGELLSAKQLFKPLSLDFKNKRSRIKTKEVALDLIEQLGQPTRIITVGGSRAYSSYEWETDKLKIKVDREGAEFLGNVFLSYKIKTDPYFVVPNP